jgi:hypothetical protein
MTRHFGDAGLVVVTSSSPAPDGDYYVMDVLADVEIDTAVFYDGYKAAAGCIDGLTFPARSFPMRLKSLSVVSGTAILYKN